MSKRNEAWLRGLLFTSMKKCPTKLYCKFKINFVSLTLVTLLKSYPRKLQQLISNLNIQKMPLFIKNVNAMLIAFIVLVLKSWLELRPSLRNSSLQRNFN